MYWQNEMVQPYQAQQPEENIIAMCMGIYVDRKKQYEGTILIIELSIYITH